MKCRALILHKKCIELLKCKTSDSLLWRVKCFLIKPENFYNDKNNFYQ